VGPDSKIISVTWECQVVMEAQSKTDESKKEEGNDDDNDHLSGNVNGEF